MLRAAFFPDFKGNDTLLLWGDNEGMAQLRLGLLGVRWGRCASFVVQGVPGLSDLTITGMRSIGVSVVTGTEEVLSWQCSPQTLDDAVYLVTPLLTSAAGHQYVDADGDLAKVVMISVNQYPDEFRGSVR